MAVVHFSQKLRDEILKKGRRIYIDKMEKHKDTFPAAFNKDLYEALMSPYIETINKLPTQFFSQITTINVLSVSGVKVEKEYTTGNPVVWPYISTSQAFKELFPYVQSEYTYRNTEINLAVKDLDGLFAHRPVLEPYREPLINWVAKAQEIKAQSEKFEAGVKDIINSYKTLAPALKAWPPLWDLLPEDAQTRHKQTATRKSANVVDELDVDLNALTSAVVSHKLGV